MLDPVCKGIKIKLLKNTVRRHYLAYQHAREPYDCGATMAEYFSPAVALHKNQFNQAMDELAKLDPNCPKDRL